LAKVFLQLLLLDVVFPFFIVGRISHAWPKTGEVSSFSWDANMRANGGGEFFQK
jgi:hypothetical protein